MTTRTYQNKFGLKKKWTANELIKLSKLNNGEVLVQTIDGDYEFTIKEV